MRVFLNGILVDTDKNTIGEGENVIEVESQTMAVLSLLITRSNELVTKQQLLDAIWQSKVVTVNSLHRVIAILRKSFEDDASQSRFIKTVHGKGYALIAEITYPAHVKKRPLQVSLLLLIVLGITLGTSWFNAPRIINFQDLGNETSLVGIEYLPQFASDNSALMFVHQPNLNSSQAALMIKSINSSPQENENMNTLFRFEGKVNGLAWSDDMRRVAIAIQLAEHCDVYHLQLDNHEKVVNRVGELLTCTPHTAIDMTWSVDGNSLFVLTENPSQETESLLFKLDLDSGKQSPVTEQIVGVDGIDRALDSNDLITFKNLANGGSEIWLVEETQSVKKIAQLEYQVTQVSWSSTMDSLLVLAKDRLFSLDLNGHIQEVKDSYRLGVSDISLGKGDTIFYNTGLSQYEMSQVVLSTRVEVETANKTVNRHELGAPAHFQQSSHNQAAASISPDGRSSVFLSDRRGQGWELWLCESCENTHISNDARDTKGSVAGNVVNNAKVNAINSEQKQNDSLILENTKRTGRVIPISQHELILATPQWRPDGKAVLLLNNQYQLIAVELTADDTSSYKTKTLTHVDDIVLAGTWAGSSSIYYSKPIDETFELFHLNLETNQETQVTTQGGYYSQLSADGTLLYFNKRNEQGLWRLKLNSGEIESVFEAFGADNYSRWQLINGQLYFRHHVDLGLGIFEYDFKSPTQALAHNPNIWLFNVNNKQSKVIISHQEVAFADIKSARLIAH